MTFERIVSLSPSNTEILYALGVEDRIVATTALCDHPAAAREKPSVGGWTNVDLEAVTSHDPDLVLATDALQDDAVAACADRGLRVKQFTPTRFHDVFNTIKAVGELVGAEWRARDLVEELNQEVRELAVNTAEERVRIYCEEWHDPAMIAGNWVPAMVRLLGGTYLIEEGERSRTVATEEIIDFDPEHIILHPCGYGADAAPETVLQRDGWADISAVQQQNVHVVDDALLNRPGPRLVAGMRHMKQVVAQNSGV